MNAISAPVVCDWTGNPAHRPLTGLGQGHVCGKGFTPVFRHGTSEETFAAASVIWRRVQEARVQGAVVQAFWTDCCDHKHLLFHNGKDCRLSNRARSIGAGYDAALAAAPAMVAAIAMAQELPVEPVRYGRDVAPAEWRDPQQTNKFSRDPQKVRGFRRIDALVLLRKRGTLKVEHVAAGFRLRDDFEIAEGALPGKSTLEHHHGRSGADEKPGVIDRQISAVARYRDAMQALGQRQAAIVVAVVLQNQTVTEWAEKRGMSLTRATGYLEAAMDCLVDHYGLGSLSSEDLARAEEG